MHLHLESPGETLWAVVIGAVLATAGGFAATQVEAFMRRRQREHSAALLFGEILSALETIITIASQARSRGEPYGPLTLRLIRAAQREIESYERSRASLYDLHQAEIRIRIHVLMVQIMLALEGVYEASDQIAAAQSVAMGLKPDDANLEPAQRRVEGLVEEREVAFTYMVTTTAEISSLVGALEPLAKVDFQALKRFSGNPYT